jgi:hypothetical protein
MLDEPPSLIDDPQLQARPLAFVEYACGLLLEGVGIRTMQDEREGCEAEDMPTLARIATHYSTASGLLEPPQPHRPSATCRSGPRYTRATLSRGRHRGS